MAKKRLAVTWEKKAETEDVKPTLDHYYRNRALLIITGIHEDGLREILGTSIAESEDSGFWSDLFRSNKTQKQTSRSFSKI